ncbi:hypothetical protein SETIT_6G111900v2 [Setaria italica]|uniref:Uncharacterized protein n=1 Tax=Setaria italica TaxID=4555 RepID=A0A368RM34_SETIT|nr:hypothetical protein SETIT_6G111900v2 [Setaria italica]
MFPSLAYSSSLARHRRRRPQSASPRLARPATPPAIRLTSARSTCNTAATRIPPDLGSLRLLRRRRRHCPAPPTRPPPRHDLPAQPVPPARPPPPLAGDTPPTSQVLRI